MNKISVLGFSGYSNLGKMTIIENLVVSLRGRDFIIRILEEGKL